MYKKILVPLDGSELSESILPHVVNLAKGCQVPEVTLLRVGEPMDRHVRETLSVELAHKLIEVNREEVASYLEKVAADLKAEGINATTVVASGNPAQEILDYAQNNDVDLILMSSHGRTGVARWAFGSVADKVLRLSPVPTLIGPAPGSRSGQ